MSRPKSMSTQDRKTKASNQQPADLSAKILEFFHLVPCCRSLQVPKVGCFKLNAQYERLQKTWFCM